MFQKPIGLKIDYPVIFGEVLCDVFSDGVEVIGGAPFNVASHLAAFGVNPLFISSIGNDERGKRILEKMEQFGLDSKGIYVHPSLSTGTARVTLNNGEPSFIIDQNVAWDSITRSSIEDLVPDGKRALLYFGTLSQRSHRTASTLQLLQKKIPRSFLDLNLRKPFYTSNLVSQSLRQAEYVKLNRDELETAFHIELNGYEDVNGAISRLMNRTGITQLVVTRGENGIESYSRGSHDGSVSQAIVSSLKIDHYEDSVGAGDGVSAVLMLGLLLKWNPETTLNRAVRFGSGICGVKGAIPGNMSFYNEFKKEWNFK